MKKHIIALLIALSSAVVNAASIAYCPKCNKPYAELNIGHAHISDIGYHHRTYHNSEPLMPVIVTVPKEIVINGREYYEGIPIMTPQERNVAGRVESRKIIRICIIIAILSVCFLSLCTILQYRHISKMYGNDMPTHKKGILAIACVALTAFIGWKIGNASHDASIT